MLPEQPPSPASISRPKLLLVEGEDAFVFFLNLLRHLRLAEIIEVRNFGGTKELGDYLETLIATPGFVQVTSLGIVRDAEQDEPAAFKSVCRSLKKANLSVPSDPKITAAGNPNVSVFILPDCVNRGMLETLCLNAVGSDGVFPCIEQFFECVSKTVGSPANMDKARLHAFLASRRKPNLSFKQATIAGYWPWDHPAFEPIIQFLRAL